MLRAFISYSQYVCFNMMLYGGMIRHDTMIILRADFVFLYHIHIYIESMSPSSHGLILDVGMHEDPNPAYRPTMEDAHVSEPTRQQHISAMLVFSRKSCFVVYEQYVRCVRCCVCVACVCHIVAYMCMFVVCFRCMFLIL